MEDDCGVKDDSGFELLRAVEIRIYRTVTVPSPRAQKGGSFTVGDGTCIKAVQRSDWIRYRIGKTSVRRKKRGERGGGEEDGGDIERRTTGL